MSEEYSRRDTKLNIIIGMSVWVIVQPKGYIHLNSPLCSVHMAEKKIQEGLDLHFAAVINFLPHQPVNILIQLMVGFE